MNGAERRASVRIDADLAIHCQGGAADRWPARIKDISTVGVGILMSQAVEAGTVLGIELSSSNGDMAYTMMVRVVHCSPQPNKRWLVGAAFLRSLSQAELDRLL